MRLSGLSVALQVQTTTVKSKISSPVVLTGTCRTINVVEFITGQTRTERRIRRLWYVATVTHEEQVRFGPKWNFRGPGLKIAEGVGR
jgi:hypothetical protein